MRDAASVGGVSGEDQAAAAKHNVVKTMSLGQRVAEEERADLASYFVETEHWRRVWNGEVDIVFAPKGGGNVQISTSQQRVAAGRSWLPLFVLFVALPLRVHDLRL